MSWFWGCPHFEDVFILRSSLFWGHLHFEVVLIFEVVFIFKVVFISNFVLFLFFRLSLFLRLSLYFWDHLHYWGWRAIEFAEESARIYPICVDTLQSFLQANYDRQTDRKSDLYWPELHSTHKPSTVPWWYNLISFLSVAIVLNLGRQFVQTCRKARTRGHCPQKILACRRFYTFIFRKKCKLKH